MKKIRQCLWVGLVIALTLTGMEALLRWIDYPPSPRPEKRKLNRSQTAIFQLDPHLGIRFQPHLNRLIKTDEFEIVIQTNGMGLRDDPIGPKNGKRILLLGDSNTAGYGVDRPFLFADRLEKALGVEVINAGTNNWDIIHQFQFYKHFGRKFDADLVVHMLYIGNDLTKNSLWKRQGDRLYGSHDENVLIHEERPLKLIQLGRQAFWKIRYLHRREIALAQRKSREWQPYGDYLALTEKKLGREAQLNYGIAKYLMSDLLSLINEDNVPYLLVIFPYKTAVEKDAYQRLEERLGDMIRYDFARPQKEMMDWAKKNRVEHLDLTPILKQAYEQLGQSLYFFKDGHPTETGHRVIADALQPILAQKLGIEGPAVTALP